MSPAPDTDLPAQRLARLLLSGCVGQALLAELSTRFRDISRSDMFWGVALAWTDREAALLAAEAEILDLRRRLARAEGFQAQEAA